MINDTPNIELTSFLELGETAYHMVRIIPQKMNVPEIVAIWKNFLTELSTERREAIFNVNS